MGSLRNRGLLRRALVLNPEGVGSRVVSGAGFQFLGIALRTIITIGSTAILARLLVPADFGYVAMATVVTEFAALFANFGFNNLLIQRRRMNRLQVDTVFWASLGLGAVLGGVVFVASFFAGWLFADERVGDLLRVLSLTFVLSGLPTIPGVVLARLMRFRVEFWIQMTTVVVRTSVAIGFAYAGFGMWSLVAGALAGACAQAVLGFLAVPYLPRWRFNSSFLTQTWRTSGSYFGGGLLFYVNMNIDLLLIGRQLGAASLGYYQNSRALTDEIRARIAVPLQHVLFPAFSAVQDSRDRMRDMVLRSGRMLAALVIPIGIGIASMSHELVPVLYGAQWLEMIPVMSMFGVSAALKASTAISTPLFNANDRVGLGFRYNIISTGLMVFGIVLAIPHGLEMVAMTIAAISLYTLLPFRAALAIIGMGVRDIAKILLAPFSSSFAFFILIMLLRPYSSAMIESKLLLLLFHAGVAASIYLCCLHLLSREYLRDFQDLLLRLRRG